MAKHLVAWTGAVCAVVGAGVVVLVPDASAAGLLLCFGGVVLTRIPTTHPVRAGHTAAAGHDARHAEQHGARP